MAQVQAKKTTTDTDTDVQVMPGKSSVGEATKAELDDLLDSIDEVLEVNAEEFVKAYVQKGGQ